MSSANDDEFHRRYEEYTRYLAANPTLRDVPPDAGLQILTEEADMLRAEEVAKRRAVGKGNPESWAETGLVYTDEYLSIVRDAVRFPNGELGTYIRVLQRREDFPGVAILAMCRGKLVLMDHYRHATRGWHWEIPRGFGETDSPERNAKLELREELGAECLRLDRLGTIHTNSGLLSEHVHLFFAEIDSYRNAEDKEPIRSIESFEPSYVRDLLCKGQITDSFTVAAVGFAEWHGFLKQS